LNVHRVSDVRQIVHTAEPFVSEPSPFEVEVATTKLRKYNSPGSHQILVDVIQAGGEAIQSLILSGIRKNFLIPEKNLLFYQFIRRAIKLAVVVIKGCDHYQLHTKFYPIDFSQVKSIHRQNYLGSSVWVLT
jgi:hypothetical protein